VLGCWAIPAFSVATTRNAGYRERQGRIMKSLFGRFAGVGAFLLITAIALSAPAIAASPWDDIEAFETGRISENSAAPFKPAPKSTPWGGWYAGMHAAAVIIPDTRFTGTGFEYLYDFDPGFALGGSFGYAYDFGLRFETEVTYRVVQARAFDFAGLTWQGSGNVDTLSLMLNSWFDVKFLSFMLGDWMPYFGAGAGIIHAWSNVGSEGAPLVEAQDTKFAWQGGGGLSYRITKGLWVSADYRFLRTFGSLSFDDPWYSDPIKAKYKTHNITLGFRGLF